MNDTRVLDNQAPHPSNANQVDPPVEEGALPPATREKKCDQKQTAHRGVILLGLLFVAVLLLYVFLAPRPRVGGRSQSMSSHGPGQNATNEVPKPSPAADPSIVPVTDALNPPKAPAEPILAEDDIDKTATRISPQGSLPPTTPGSLGAIPEFSQVSASNNPGTLSVRNPDADTTKSDQENPNSSPPSLVFTRRAVPNSSSPTLDLRTDGLRLPPGFRLRARLESASTTAIRMPVVAVIEYNYERNGTVIVPAGTKAIGHIEQADRSGYMSIRFESLVLPEAGTIPIDSVATDPSLHPLRGRVEGSNTGKQILVRSLTGIGEIGSLLVGRSGLNQPFSESDMLRERIGQNIGQASDQQLTALAVTQHIVVTLPANTPIYLVLQQASRSLEPRERPAMSNGSEQQNIDQLRQLLQLQRELAATQDR